MLRMFYANYPVLFRNVHGILPELREIPDIAGCLRILRELFRKCQQVVNMIYVDVAKIISVDSCMSPTFFLPFRAENSKLREKANTVRRVWSIVRFFVFLKRITVCFSFIPSRL